MFVVPGGISVQCKGIFPEFKYFTSENSCEFASFCRDFACAGVKAPLKCQRGINNHNYQKHINKASPHLQVHLGLHGSENRDFHHEVGVHVEVHWPGVFVGAWPRPLRLHPKH